MLRDDKINILIVDDRPENLLALEAIIEKSDFHIIKATSGEEALIHLLKYDFATILLDVQMPGIDGFETARIIQAREKTNHIPIIFITANHMDAEHIFTGYSVGAIDYILKPFDPFILKAKVIRFVDIYRMNQKLIQQAETITHMAYHDSLTNLPNRRKFIDLLQVNINQAKQSNTTFALMYLDMDRFKYVNDSLGHHYGDQLLQEISQRLLESVGGTDIVARIGGDEFNILLPNTNRENAIEIAEHMIASFKSPFYLDNYEVYITASLGISMFPYDGEDSIVLMKNCDAALYRAKEHGKNTYKIFHYGMNIQSYRSYILQNDLRKAIERQELTLVYQPRIELEHGGITSAEVLVQWNHPNWGVIMSSEFIPLAEETGQIIEIGEWVLHATCLQMNAWQQSGLSPIRIAIHFSPQLLLQKNLIEKLNHISSETDVQLSSLEFEITESALLAVETNTTLILSQLRQLGITISIDDFGTGCSSLSYLRHYPLDILKIDQSFIQDISPHSPENIAFIASIVSLGHSLNMSIIAEGVNTQEQLNALKKINCNECQGSFICAPLPPTEFELFLNKQAPKKIPKPAPFIPDESLDQHQLILKLAIHRTKELYGLSSREIEVFELIVGGLSNKEISSQLFISEHTVKNHITHIFQKLNITDRMQALSNLYQISMEEGHKLRSQLRTH